MKIYKYQKIYFSINYDQIFVESPSSKPLIEIIRNHETDDYIISSKGWLGVEMREYHTGGDYQNTLVNPGYFDFSIQNYRKIDFNNDSIEDIIFTVEFFPHTVEKQSNIYKNQLIECGSSLNRKKYIIFLL